MKAFKDYLRYVAQYSFFDSYIGIIYEKDNPYKRFILVCLYILVRVSGHLCWNWHSGIMRAQTEASVK